MDCPLRKPPAVIGDVRVVEVEGFDWSACGGTHVNRTGEVGLIKIIKWEKRGAETRVEFRCGQRALNDYRQKNSMVNRLATIHSVVQPHPATLRDRATHSLPARVTEQATSGWEAVSHPILGGLYHDYRRQAA